MLYAMSGEYDGESMHFDFPERELAEDEFDAFVAAGAINVTLSQFELLAIDPEFGPIFGDIVTIRTHSGY